MSKADEISNLTRLWRLIRTKIAASLTKAKAYTDSAVAAIEPDHAVADRSSANKLIITIGTGASAQKFAIDREPLEAPADPTFKIGSTPVVSGSEYVASTGNIKIECETDGATIYYTTDGNDPTTSSDTIASGGTLSFSQSNGDKVKTYTLKAMAVKNGEESEISTATFKVKRQLSAPSIGTPIGNANSESRAIVISGTSGDTLNYSYSDGTNTTTGTVAASANEAARTITISTKGTWSIEVYASRADWENSAAATKTGIVVKQIATPSITPASGSTDYDSSRTVTLACGTSGSSLYYRYATTDEWTAYASALSISSTKTIYVKAEKDGWTTATNSSTVTVGAAHTHYGLSARTTADATTLGEMASEVKAAAPTGMYTFTSDGTSKYMWIFVPASQAAITQIKNANNMNQIDAWTSETASINGVSYRCYRTKSTTSQTSKWAINQDWSNN